MSPVPDLSAIPEPYRARWRQRRMLLFYILFHSSAAFLVLPWPWLSLNAGDLTLKTHTGQGLGLGLTVSLTSLLAAFIAGSELMDRRRRDALRSLVFGIALFALLALSVECLRNETPFIREFVESQEFRDLVYNARLQPGSKIQLRVNLGLSIALFAVLNAAVTSAYLWKLHPEHDPSRGARSEVA